MIIFFFWLSKKDKIGRENTTKKDKIEEEEEEKEKQSRVRLSGTGCERSPIHRCYPTTV